MANKITITAQARQVIGKKVKALRLQGLVPANVMGGDVKPTPISLGKSAFDKLYRQVGDTGLVYLTIEGEKVPRPVLLDEVSYHPVTNQAMHAVFKQVDLKEKITAEIPVELVGESGVKDGVVLLGFNTIEVEALPTDFPESFEIDISALTEVGQGITFNELVYDRSKVTLMIDEDQLDSPVVTVQGAQQEVEETEEPIEGEVPAESEAPAAEAATE
ncbi:MAG: 50S ribosomal protein L25 [bacterium]|nr:50S ribosomal protein L25 [bacterium]